MVQLLPSSWMQKRTVTLNYQVARAMRFARRYHKLTEWHTLCDAFENLPYGKEFIAYEKPKKLESMLTYILNKLNIPYVGKENKEMNSEQIWKNIIEHFGGTE